jgi:hypothetical protein
VRFDEAVRQIERHGLAILTQPKSNIRLLAVGAKDHGPLSEATDFCITAYVPEKLTKAQLRDRDLLPFDLSVAAAAGAEVPPGIELDVVESGLGLRATNVLISPRGVPRPVWGADADDRHTEVL